MLAEGQIKRLKEQCIRVNESYNAGPETLDFKDNDYYVNLGWIQALSLVLEKDTHPIPKTSLKTYEKGYNILIQFWNHIPDHVKPKVNKELKELGL